MADLELYEGSSKWVDGAELVYDPLHERYLPVSAAKRVFPGAARPALVESFRRRRTEMVRSSRRLSEAEKAARIARLTGPPGGPAAPPVPGGVGYGTFYREGELTFVRSAILHHHILCPLSAGGDNANYLYLTATNRSAKGVEALVSYKAQEPLTFSVFDWARPDGQQWQLTIAEPELRPYLSRLDRTPLLAVVNSTDFVKDTTWRNRVLLFNNETHAYDVVYEYSYALASNDEQHDVDSGSWGPIVETFQQHYGPDLNPMGCFRTYLVLDDSLANLNDRNSFLREDPLGIERVTLTPNHSYVVH